MSEQTQSSKQQGKSKGLGRGLGSLLGNTGEGAFSKTTPSAENVLASLKEDLPSQKVTALKDGFVENEVAKKLDAPAEQVVAPTPSVPANMRIWQIPIEKIFPNPNQPRQIFEKEPLQELANSIREKGIIQPLLVRKSDEDTFEIIAGERRWRAAQIAGLKEVPAILKDSPEQEVLELALIENIQRENLNPIEEAEAYDFLVKKYNLTQQDLAHKVGKDRATVANMLRLLGLQPGVRQMVSRGELSMGQAKVLLSLPDPRIQEKLAEKAKVESLSVRALEKLVARAKLPSSSAESDKRDLRDKMAKSLEEELQKLIGSKVNLDYDAGKGKIVIHYYSDQELNQIADTLRDSWRR